MANLRKYSEVILCTIKLTRAKLTENAGKFTRGLHVKRPHRQFTCITCSLLVETGKFTCGTASRQKTTENAGKNTRIIAGKNTRNCRQKYLQLHAICYDTAGKFTSKKQVS